MEQKEEEERILKYNMEKA